MSNTKSDRFRDLKASFGTCSKPTTAITRTSFHQSLAGDLANMSSDKLTKPIPSVAQSIDQILATPAAKQTVRPLAKLRPSWIGPPRQELPKTPGVQAMKQHATVQYSSPGLQPPVYIFTNLSDPQWDAVEMRADKNDKGEFDFIQSFDVEEGEYQYKFRLGPGDWWVCDETRTTVDDGSGNKNNLFAVKSSPLKPEQPAAPPKANTAASPSEVQTAPKPPATLLPQPAPQHDAVMTAAHEDLSAPAPLMKHETFAPKAAEAQQTPEREQTYPFEDDPDDSQVLMKHETLTPDKNKDSDSISDDDDGSSSSSSSSSSGPDESSAPPLLRHESLSPSSKEQEHAPLFRHESIRIGYNHHKAPAASISPARLSRKASSVSSIPAEADPHDTSLEKFPTDHAGIIDKIHRTSTWLPVDETDDDDVELGSPISQALSESSISPPSLPSVREDEDEEKLQKIREVEEEEFEKEEASGEEMDPLRPAAPITPPLTPNEPEDADFEPKVSKPQETVVIEETIVVDVVEQRKNVLETVLESLGGKGNAM